MRYCGCVTDKEFHKALLEMYPDRKLGSEDSMMRKFVASQHRDLYELILAMAKRESIRYHAS